MRKINLNEPSDQRFVRALILGAPKSGKTFFAASAPKPLFISDAAEGGYETLRSMDPRLWWEPSIIPEVWAIEDLYKDMPTIHNQLEHMKATNTFPYGTIIIDPISIYADRALAEMQMRASRDGKTADSRQLYGDLATHLRVFILRMHALPCNVLWLCHIKDGGLALAGQTAEKLPAYMDFTWLCETTASGIATKYELHTQPYGAYTQLGGRWSVADASGTRYGLPTPMVPSFKCVAQVLNRFGKPFSSSVPGFPNGVNYTWPPQPKTNTESEA